MGNQAMWNKSHRYVILLHVAILGKTRINGLGMTTWVLRTKLASVKTRKIVVFPRQCSGVSSNSWNFPLAIVDSAGVEIRFPNSFQTRMHAAC